MTNIFSRKISIHTNSNCNLNCVYCYENKSKVSKFDVKSLKQYLKTVLCDTTANGTQIDFHGGEPLLVFGEIQELCEWAWNNNFEEKFVFTMTTNGTLLSKEKKTWFTINKEKIILKLSIDGNSICQNITRPKSFDFIDLEFFSKNWSIAKVTLAPSTVEHLHKSVTFLHTYFKSIFVTFALFADWSANSTFQIFKEEYDKLIQYYCENSNIEPCSLCQVPFERLINNYARKWCSIGSKTCIDTDLNTYPCHLFLPNVCGEEIAKQSTTMDFSDLSPTANSECSKCTFLNICPTCVAENIIVRGDFKVRNMNLCKYHKHRFVQVANMYINSLKRGGIVSPLFYKKIVGINKIFDSLKSYDDETNCQ